MAWMTRLSLFLFKAFFNKRTSAQGGAYLIGFRANAYAVTTAPCLQECRVANLC